MAQLKTIQSLQAGRGLAALAVVFHHADLAAHDFGRDKMHVLPFANGYLGVDFFFVLSGFIIYHSTVGRGRSAAEYAWARFRRVYLPYWPIGIGLALLYLALPSLSQGDRHWSWLPTLTLLPVSSETALAVAWTLKHEILFYAVFGCLYFMGLLRFGLPIWCCIIVGARIAGITNLVPLQLINLEFLMGIVIAILYRAGRGHAALLLIAPIPFIAWVLLGADRDWSVLVGPSLALVILPVAQLEAEGRFKVPYLLTFLGAASYSLYLVHDTAISLAARLFRGDPYWVVVSASVVAGVAGGLLYFAIVERTVLRVAPGDRRHQRLTGEESTDERPPEPAARA